MSKELIEQFVEEALFINSNQEADIVHLWDNNYRVNVWGFNPNRVENSYFVMVTDSGVKNCTLGV